MKKTVFTAMACALLLAGCATTPDITVAYYLPKSSPSLRVVRTVACDEAGRITVLSSVLPATNLGADPDKRHTVALKDLDGKFANADLGLVLLDDGRLSSINGAQSGQGSEIVKAGVQVASSLVPGGGLLKLAPGLKSNWLAPTPLTPPAPKTEAQAACEDIRKASGEEPGVALFFESQNDLFAPGGRQGELQPTVESRTLYEVFGAKVMGLPCFESGPVATPQAPIGLGELDSRKFMSLIVRQPATGKVTLRVPGFAIRGDRPTLSACTDKLWSGSFTLPQYGAEYVAPIPKAVAFGKSSVLLGFSDAGALTGVKYGKDSGLASALTSASDAYNGLVVTGADQKAQDEAEADAIAHHQRLLLCRKDNSKCEV